MNMPAQLGAARCQGKPPAIAAMDAVQGVATAAAINLERLGAWLSLRPFAPTRTSACAAAP